MQMRLSLTITLNQCLNQNITLKKNYFKVKKDNFFEIILIASDFSNCFEKAKNFYRSQYNKEASSIEVTQIKRATNTSTNLSNQQKLVA
jgi:hypothetical protein